MNTDNVTPSDGSLPSFADLVADGIARGLTAAEAVGAFQQAVDQSAPLVVADLLARIPALVEDHNAVWADIERVVHETWGDALDLTLASLVAADEMMRAWVNRNVEGAQQSGDVLFAAVSALSAGALRAAFETWILLVRGMRDGGSARARSVHEAAVTIRVLVGQVEAYPDLPQRFFDHEAIDQRHYARAHNAHAAAIGDAPIEDERMAGVEERCRLLVDRYGPDFEKPYGWAAPAMTGERLGFAALERLAGLAHWRPAYKRDSLAIHPTAWGSSLAMEAGGHVTTWRLTGLSEPAGSMLVSLRLVTADALLRGRMGAVDTSDFLTCAVLEDLSDRAIDALASAHDAAEERAAMEQLRPDRRPTA